MPIPKSKECYSKSLFCDDFRAIAINPILSIVFEHYIFKHYHNFLLSSDNQFRFKKKSDAIMQSEPFAVELTVTWRRAVQQTLAQLTFRKHSTE